MWRRYVYEDGPFLICPECVYEWSAAEEAAKAEAALVKDANGNVLQDGDTVVITTSTAISRGFGAMSLKSEYVKKA